MFRISLVSLVQMPSSGHSEDYQGMTDDDRRVYIIYIRYTRKRRRFNRLSVFLERKQIYCYTEPDYEKFIDVPVHLDWLFDLSRLPVREIPREFIPYVKRRSRVYDHLAHDDDSTHEGDPALEYQRWEEELLRRLQLYERGE